MPEGIFDDYRDGAELCRAQWVAENRPDVSFQELHHCLPLRWDTIRHLLFEPFETPYGMPEDLFWDTTAGKKDEQGIDHPGGNDLRRRWVAKRYDVTPEELAEIESLRTQTLARLVLSRTVTQ